MDGIQIRTNAVHPPEQRRIIGILRDLREYFYVPKTPYGNSYHLSMMCMGMHWNPITYKYDTHRNDYDKRLCPQIPELLLETANLTVKEMYPDTPDLPSFDLCVCNWYQEGTGKLGLHRDNSESPESIKAGYPVLSLSFGASAHFSIGPSQIDQKRILLKSGDAIAFGGSSRLWYHGITQIISDTCPKKLEMPKGGRINLTFRVY